MGRWSYGVMDLWGDGGYGVIGVFMGQWGYGVVDLWGGGVYRAVELWGDGFMG